MTEAQPGGYVRGLALAAREAQRAIAGADAATRRRLLGAMAGQLLAAKDAVLAANAADLAKAAVNGASKATLVMALPSARRVSFARYAGASVLPVAITSPSACCFCPGSLL